jgi:two-component system LytT family response regulator
MKIRTLLVDDEPLSRLLLKSILAEYGDVEVVGECDCGRRALEMVSVHAPDLVFLDVQMPGMTGVDVVAQLPRARAPLVIFATAHSDYAVSAFEVEAVDYVLKPFDRERVARALSRARERLEAMAAAGSERSHGALDGGEGSAPGGRLAICDAGNVTLVPLAEIDWVDAAGDYMCVHASGRTHILRSTMKELVQKLDAAMFRQIHRSTVVNIERVREITRLKKGECLLHLDDATTLKVSRNYRTAIAPLLK